METELTVQGDGVCVTVRADLPREQLASVATAAFLAAEASKGLLLPASALKGMRSSSGSQASRIREAAKPHAGGKNGRAKSSTNARVREIAETVLADGRVHERREIGAAVKAAGLPPTAVIGALRNRYQEGHNVDGRPTYCDASVASPYLDPREVADADKPNWMRNHGAAHEPGDAETIAAANGGPK